MVSKRLRNKPRLAGDPLAGSEPAPVGFDGHLAGFEGGGARGSYLLLLPHGVRLTGLPGIAHFMR